MTQADAAEPLRRMATHTDVKAGDRVWTSRKDAEVSDRPGQRLGKGPSRSTQSAARGVLPLIASTLLVRERRELRPERAQRSALTGTLC